MSGAPQNDDLRLLSGHLGTTIRLRRKELGLTQKVLAERSGMSTPVVNRIESGKAVYPKPQYIHSLGRALGLDLSGYIRVERRQATREWLRQLDQRVAEIERRLDRAGL